MFLYSGYEGKSLREIVTELGNKDYNVIECRCLWKDADGIENDDLFGYCSYKNGELSSLDGDTYSLDDLYIKWKEWIDTDGIFEDKGLLVLTVWEAGVQSDDPNILKEI